MMMPVARVMAALVVLGLASTLAAGDTGLSQRWLFVMRNLSRPEQVEKTIALFPRAAKDGYTAVVISDSKLYSLHRMDQSYLDNVKRVQQAAFDNGLDLIPCVMPIGYAGGILDYDPNLHEGIPVKEAPFVVKGKEARLVPDPAVTLPGGDFEQAEGNRFAGWEMQDNVGTGSFADREVFHSGQQSVRMENIPRAEPKWGHSRLSQSVKLQPFRQYHLSAWVKTEDFEETKSVRMLVLAPTENERELTDLALEPKRTQDWTRYDVLFNSFGFSDVRIYIGAWGGKNGRIWWDDVKIEEVPGILNVIRREGCPVSVKGEDGVVYEEGRDFEPIRDPELAAYFTLHEPLPIRLTADSRIPDGRGCG